MRKAIVLMTAATALGLSACSSASTPDPVTPTSTTKASPVSTELTPEDMPKSCATVADFKKAKTDLDRIAVDRLQEQSAGGWPPPTVEKQTLKVTSKIVCGGIGAAAEIETTLSYKPMMLVLQWRYAARKALGQPVTDKDRLWEFAGVSNSFAADNPVCADPTIRGWLMQHGSCVEN